MNLWVAILFHSTGMIATIEIEVRMRYRYWTEPLFIWQGSTEFVHWADNYFYINLARESIINDEVLMHVYTKLMLSLILTCVCRYVCTIYVSKINF